MYLPFSFHDRNVSLHYMAYFFERDKKICTDSDVSPRE